MTDDNKWIVYTNGDKEMNVKMVISENVKYDGLLWNIDFCVDAKFERGHPKPGDDDWNDRIRIYSIDSVTITLFGSSGNQYQLDHEINYELYKALLDFVNVDEYITDFAESIPLDI